MRSRALRFILTLVLCVLVASPAAETQPRRQLPLIGVLEPGPQRRPTPASCHAGFWQGLRDLGYVEGQTITVAYRYAEEQRDRLPALAAELARLTPDVLWTHSDPPAQALKQATTTIPIVVGVASELMTQGLVAHLAQPGGNLTGMELRDVELTGKRLELFKEAVPTISRVAVLVDPTMPASKEVPHHIAPEARALGVQLQRVEASSPQDFEGAFATMVQGGAAALMIMEGPLLARHRQQLLELARGHRLPTMAGGRHFAEAGSLVAYGAYPRDLCQRSAVFVDKILKGAKPADLPVERADQFSLVVNLKTAEALSLTLSPLFLSKADEVIT